MVNQKNAMELYLKNLIKGHISEDKIKQASLEELHKIYLNLLFQGKVVEKSQMTFKSNNHKHHSEKLEKCIKIRQKDFLNGGITITKPGNYCIVENIIFVPTENSQNAITIQSSNISIDFRNHTLDGSSLGFIGINTFGSFQNIKILNGTITNFTGFGISFNQAFRPGIPPTSNILIDHFRISSIRGTSTTEVVRGISASSLRNFTISNSLIDNIAGIGGAFSSVNAISFEFCDIVTIDNCSIDQIDNTFITETTIGQGSSSGIFLRVTTTAKIVNNNIIRGIHVGYPNNINFVEGIGIDIFLSDDITLTDFSCNDVTAVCGNAIGISLSNNLSRSSNCFIQNGKISSVICQSGESGTNASGLRAIQYNSATVNNCVATDIESFGSGFATGFSDSGSTVTFTGCNASYVVALNKSVGFGFYPNISNPDASSSNIVWKDCVAENCGDKNLSELSIGIGFDLFAHNQCTLINSISQNNTDYGLLNGDSIVIGSNSCDIIPPTEIPNTARNNVIKNNLFANNGVSARRDTTGKNIYIDNTETRTPI
jgi:hypothetical protein